MDTIQFVDIHNQDERSDQIEESDKKSRHGEIEQDEEEVIVLKRNTLRGKMNTIQFINSQGKEQTSDEIKSDKQSDQQMQETESQKVKLSDTKAIEENIGDAKVALEIDINGNKDQQEKEFDKEFENPVTNRGPKAIQKFSVPPLHPNSPQKDQLKTNRVQKPEKLIQFKQLSAAGS